MAWCGLIFRTNPGFMLAGVLLILFVNYMLQVKHQPYMSASQRSLVLAEHKIKVAAGNKQHLMIAQSVKVALETKNSKKKRSGQKLRGQFAHHTGFYASNKDLLASRKNSTLTSAQLKKKRAAKKAAKQDRKQFFFDYNTVEQVCLACAILVCLSGVMFESDRFQAVDASGNLRYGWMRDVLTYAIITVVMGSLVYLLFVTVTEVTGFTPRCIRRCLSDRQSAMLQAADQLTKEQESRVEMRIVNPMDSVRQQQQDAEMDKAKREVELLRQQNKSLKKKGKQLSKAKQMTSKGRGASKSKNKGKKGKKGFSARRASYRADQDIPAARALEASKSGAGTTGSVFFHPGPSQNDHNVETNSTQWKQPAEHELSDSELAGGAVEVTAEAAEDTAQPVVKKKSRSFKAVKDPRGRTYYYNVDTKDTQWHKPEDHELVDDEEGANA